MIKRQYEVSDLIRIMFIFSILFSVLFLNSCGYKEESEEWRKELKNTRNELSKQIEETRKATEKIGESAIKAVPGERWLQILDALAGPD